MAEENEDRDVVFNVFPSSENKQLLVSFLLFNVVP